MKEERSWLLREGIPLLHELGQETGLIMQLVDLQWGVNEDIALDPELYSVHLEQINYSRQYSAGPFFAVRMMIPFFLLMCKRYMIFSLKDNKNEKERLIRLVSVAHSCCSLFPEGLFLFIAYKML